MKLVLAANAVADIARLRAFLQVENRAAAERALSVIDEAIQTLAIFPNRGRPSGIPSVRELIVPFGRSAYVVRYAHLPQTDRIVILRIWHGRENR